ncbi:DUF1189 family protein [Pseudogracilibacillus sp. SE30717A]|uniref:DUF1189 family protein n=1 Tax=Pseudogracilibacillus sp. SE30717A TaxID=3098293 RepID=UPI00300DC656
MKVYWNALIHSFKLPIKQSVFALNRIGMDITVIYLFFLLGLASLPALYEQVIVNDSSSVQTFFLLIYFFIFYYLPLVLIVFSILSLFAYIGTLLARFSERKLRYSIMWKMAAFATTLPLLSFSIVSFFHPLSPLFLLISAFYIFFILIKIIFIYPKRKSQK